MDDLVYICTKIARQMDVSGLDRVFDAAEAATAAVEEARPLLARVVELVDEARRRRAPQGLLGRLAVPGGAHAGGRSRRASSGVRQRLQRLHRHHGYCPSRSGGARTVPRAEYGQGARRGVRFVQRVH